MKTKNKIGIIGQGFVGNAIYQKFKNFYEVLTYDLDESKCNSTKDWVFAECTNIFVCLPTPMNIKDGSCNVDIIDKLLDDLDLLADNHETSRTIIVKSTIPPGTTQKWNERFRSLNVIFNPEFLTERNAVEDFNNQDRIILGGPRPYTSEVKRIFSKVFPKARIIKTNSNYAEMIKYTTNAFLATKVSFANEIFKICEQVGADYDKVIEYATLDDRLGTSHWNVPGHDGDFGFGGHCFPKDLSALLHVSNKLDTVNNVLTAAMQTNETVREDRDWEKMTGRAVI